MIVVLFYDIGVFSKYITEIDFVGYITFFVALFFVAHAMYIMILSMHTSKVYSHLHCMSVADIIGDYTNMCSNLSKFFFEIPYLPISSLRQAVEFKIIYALFRDTYWLPSDFDYGSYLGHSFEKYSLRMINIGLSSWVIMIVLCGVNYARIVLGKSIDFLSCHSNFYNTHNVSSVDEEGFESWDPFAVHRTLEEQLSQECSHMHLMIFVTCGAAIAIYVLALFLIGRFYLKRLVARAGVTHTSDFYKFLMLEESITLKQTATRSFEVKRQSNSVMSKKGRRMSTNTLKNNVYSLLKEKPKDESEGDIYKTISEKSRISKSRLGTVMSGLKKRFILPSVSSASLDDDDNNNERRSMLHKAARSKRQTVLEKCKGMVTSSHSKQTPTRRKNMIVKLSKGNTKQNLKVDDDVESLTSIEQFKLLKIKEMRKQKLERSKSNKRMMMSYLRDKSATDSSNLDMKLSEDLSDIYFFRSPQFYFKMVEIAIMLNSLYLSLWACNFISLVNEHFNRSAFYHIVMLVPLLIVLPALGEIVKVSSLLAAIANLDLDVIGSVLEATEEKEKLVKEVREKILDRIYGQGIKDKMIILKELFREIDANNNGTVSKYELREMLRILSLHYSDRKFRKLYNAIDQDGSGAMDMDEFMDLVFPDMGRQRDVQRRAMLLKKHSDAYDEAGNKNIDFHQSFKSTIERFQTEIIIPEKQELESNRMRTESGDDVNTQEEYKGELPQNCDLQKSSNSDVIENIRMSGIWGKNNMGVESICEHSHDDEQSVDTATTPINIKKTGVATIGKPSLTNEEVDKVKCHDEKILDVPKYSIDGHHVTENSTFSAVPRPERLCDDITFTQTTEDRYQADEILDFLNKPNEEGKAISELYSDDASDISAFDESICKFESNGEDGVVSVLTFNDDQSFVDQQSLGGNSYYSVCDSDDNSLMTATIRGNQESKPFSKKPCDPKREQSIELSTLLRNESVKNNHHDSGADILSFTLNQRAATALNHIATQQHIN